MTRKDYTAIATALKVHQTAVTRLETERRRIVESIADVMQADNPLFDRARFLAACGF